MSSITKLQVGNDHVLLRMPNEAFLGVQSIMEFSKLLAFQIRKIKAALECIIIDCMPFLTEFFFAFNFISVVKHLLYTLEKQRTFQARIQIIFDSTSLILGNN